MIQEEIALVMIEDREGYRNSSLRWLCGQPGDAVLFLAASKQSLLVPWDINIGMLYAEADALVPYAEFGRQPVRALKGAIEHLKISKGSRVEIPGTTPYPRFLQYVEEVQDFDIICREEGVWTELEKSRAVKDADEINIYRKLAAQTDEMIKLVEKNVQDGTLKSEMDIALFIESESRKLGCDGTGIDIIAAGPSRSFGIHAVPPYTAEAFGGNGFSILDFGLKYAGYTTDVTLTFARDPISKAQEKMLSLVEKAYKLAISMVKGGAYAKDIAIAVDTYFARSKKVMPHGLGHGIGLDGHEAPWFWSRASNEWVLEPGMIIAIEPALYDPVHGGCRLENNILITDKGAEILTDARIIRL